MMDWPLVNPQTNIAFSLLGGIQNEKYVIGENALRILDEISIMLSCEDQTLRTFRRSIGFSQNIKKDLIPLLVNAKDSKILDEVIRIIVNLTVPVECLFSVEVMLRTEVGRCSIFEVNRLLVTSKEAFTDAKASKAVIEHMDSILKEDARLSVAQCDNINNCLLLLRNILHIPEINISGGHSSNMMQNQILWNLFTQKIDKLLLHLMACGQRASWSITMVQLIALMYKDQHVNTLQKMLNIWFEAAMSESSEDNESNTSPPQQDGGDSSPMLTSDPTSDSSDNGGGGGAKITDRQLAANKEAEALHQLTQSDFECTRGTLKMSQKPSLETVSSMDTDEAAVDMNSPSSQSSYFQESMHKISAKGGSLKKRDSLQSEVSDCGYGTQVENQESISTSSNEEDIPQKKVHQKPPCNQKQRYNAAIKLQQSKVPTAQDKKDLRKKKAGKRVKCTIMNMGNSLHHTCTDEDISNILKEFTVDFLLRGYNCLVRELYMQVLTDMNVQIDTCHFFWLVTYFLKFVAQLELDLENISWVLSFDIISYLTFEGASLCEQLELISKQPGTDLKPCLRRMHLVVTAIRESLQALETYKKSTHLCKNDRDHLRALQLQIGAAEDLRCLFILLLRRYNPTIHSKQYLQDLVITNHILLLLLDDVSKMPEYNGNIKMMDHIKQFATIEIMHHYGLLLDNFRENGEYVNDCILTMMHHIGGDLGQITTLFQPVILKTFSKIWELEYTLCDDWSDLIEYVIHKFINKPKQSSLEALSGSTITDDILMAPEETFTTTWTQDEMNFLYWYYVQSKKQKDLVGCIVELYCNNGNTKKSRISVIQQLLQQDIITLVGYDDLMKLEDVECRDSIRVPSPSTSTQESGIEVKEISSSDKTNDDISVLRERVYKDNKGHLITWLQKVLIDCYYVKLNLQHIHPIDIESSLPVRVMESLPYHCMLKNVSIPLMPWTSEQHSSLTYQPFVLLLHKLGFHLPADVDKLFVRIPGFWTADILLSTAEKLGAIDRSKLNPSVEQPNRAAHKFVECEKFIIPRPKQSTSIIRGFTPDPDPMKNTSTNWLELVMSTKDAHPNRSIEKLISGASGIEAEVAVTTSTVTTPTMSSLCETITRLSPLQSAGPDGLLHADVILSPTTTDSVSRQAATMEIDGDHLTPIDEHEVVSICDTASVASDLTRMYVSDEEHDLQTDALL